MKLGRARVIKGAFSQENGPFSVRTGAHRPSPRDTIVAQRLPAAVLEARDEALRIVREAERTATELVQQARRDADDIAQAVAREAREQELARVGAEIVAVRIAEEERRARELDRSLDLAVLLAERLLGEALQRDPSRLRTLAAQALVETRGARQLRIECHPDDAAELAAFVQGHHSAVVDIEPTMDMSRGSLILHTELGRVDARLHAQLTRLGAALRDAMASAKAPPHGTGT